MGAAASELAGEELAAEVELGELGAASAGAVNAELLAEGMAGESLGINPAAESQIVAQNERLAAAKDSLTNAPSGASVGPAKSALTTTGEAVAGTVAAAGSVAAAVAIPAGFGWSLSKINWNNPLMKITPSGDVFDPMKDKPLGDVVRAAKWVPYALAAAIFIPAFRVFFPGQK